MQSALDDAAAIDIDCRRPAALGSGRSVEVSCAFQWQLDLPSIKMSSSLRSDQHGREVAIHDRGAAFRGPRTFPKRRPPAVTAQTAFNRLFCSDSTSALVYSFLSFHGPGLSLLGLHHRHHRHHQWSGGQILKARRSGSPSRSGHSPRMSSRMSSTFTFRLPCGPFPRPRHLRSLFTSVPSFTSIEGSLATFAGHISRCCQGPSSSISNGS